MKQAAIFAVLTLLLLSPQLMAREQVGELITETLESLHPYPAEKGVVWEHEISEPGASYIAVHFSRFDLAPGDHVELSSPDSRFSYRYSGRGKMITRFRPGSKTLEKQQISAFWATHVPGDRVLIRLISSGARSSYGFVIDQWARGYAAGDVSSRLDAELDLSKAVCSNDDGEWARCYDGMSMYDRSRAVVRLLINGNTACTGWLLGSEGHVMTNEHCIETQSDADNTDFELMAEGATCTTDCSSWLACPGTVEASSGTLVRVDYDLDYALVLLPTNITGSYGYLQLRSTLPEVGERIYIPQHPHAWGKQLTVNSDLSGPYATVYGVDQAPCHGGPGDIGYYADTGGGSSGAPVLGYSDDLVVALHHCGTCPNRGVPVTAIISDLGPDLPADAVAGVTPPPQYCTAYSKNQRYEWIAQVQIADLSHSTSASAYSDLSHHAATLNAGSSTAVTLTPGYAGHAFSLSWMIWIDLDNDGDFTDPGEDVYTGTGSSALSGSLSIPPGISGDRRMRVAMRFGAPPSSCGSFTYGEVEDYTVKIQ